VQQPDYILDMKGIGKQLPGVRALANVDFKVARGHVHALVGENGAGKSTIIKIISGVYTHGNYDGQLFYDGREMKFRSILDVAKEGIACIHQELNVVPELSVSENIFLNEKPTRFGFIDFDRMYADSMKLLKKIGLNTDGNSTISPDEKVKNLGIGQKQMVEIAKALAKEVRLLLLDEPTAALTETEVDVLLDIICNLRKKGVTCIYISHRLDEIMRIADEITVLRDGQIIETRRRADIDKETMISLMVGRELKNMFPRVPHKRGELVLEIKHYSVENPDVAGKKLIEDMNLQVYRGEILGISGLMGAGRTELFTALFGAYREKGHGEVMINGKRMNITNPKDALKNGFFLISEDRKKFGLNLIMSVKENTTLAALRKVSKYGVLDDDKEVSYTTQCKTSLRIAVLDINTAVSNLSGGNQQKVVFAKALVCEPQIIVLDEPTRGIDVGSKYEIYKLMNDLVDRGVAIIMISSEMEEILGMSDRIITMANGKATGEFDISEATQEILMQASVPGR
jgi:D-xylose transport system ATP-binding protein